MPITPSVKAFTGTSVEVLNSIRNSASTNYRNFVPFAQPDSASVKKIGATIMQYPALQNEFLNNLINRIGLVIVSSRLYDNPWKVFKKGMLEMGESIEEIFVNIAKVNLYDPTVAEQNVFKREIPDVRATFHLMNYQRFYKDTISEDQLRQAFVSWEGVTDLIARITESMYTSAAYDEFLVMKYMLARRILDNNIYKVIVDSKDIKDYAKTIKDLSNKMEFLNDSYNIAGVHNHSKKQDQYLICTSEFDANMDVDVLAFAFNMDKVEFSGHRILVNSFSFDDGESARLAEIFANDSNYVQISDDEADVLRAVTCVIVDKDYIRVYDNLLKFTEIYNSEGLYWNYALHTWKTFSTSPFEQAVALVPESDLPTYIDFTTNLRASYIEGTGVLDGTIQLTSIFNGYAESDVVPALYNVTLRISDGLVSGEAPLYTIPTPDRVPGQSTGEESVTWIWKIDGVAMQLLAELGATIPDPTQFSAMFAQLVSNGAVQLIVDYSNADGQHSIDPTVSLPNGNQNA